MNTEYRPEIYENNIFVDQLIEAFGCDYDEKNITLIGKAIFYCGKRAIFPCELVWHGRRRAKQGQDLAAFLRSAYSKL